MTKLVQWSTTLKALTVAGLLIAAFSTFSVRSNPQLSAAWESWYPYQFTNDQGELSGVDIRFFEAVMMKSGFSYSIDEVSWKMQLFMIKAGQLDVGLGVSKTPERETFAKFSIPYRQERVNLFMLKGHSDKYPLASLSSLTKTNLKIGTEQGYYYGDEFDQLSEDPDFSTRFHEVEDVEENVSLLLKGKLHGLLADPHTMKSIVDRLNLNGKIEQHPLLIYSSDIHFMFSKESVSDNTIKTINMVISDMKRSGQAQQLLGI